jgi:Domain of unknown function (DUF4136)
MKRALAAVFSMALTAFLMTGCASTRLVDSDVTAFSAWTSAPPAPGTSYRFERLPSQQANPQQDQLEALAQTSLARVGMVRAEAAAPFTVQVVAGTQRVERLFDDGFLLGGPGLYGGPFGYGPYGGGPFGSPFSRFGELYYTREVRLQMRDLRSNQVVFESRALHDGPWSDSWNVYPAMLDAALAGFPQPVPGRRRIDVQIGR